MADDARQRIIEVAAELFADHGFPAVSLRDIATRADVTHGLVRHHFGSKEGLWQAVLHWANTTFDGALAEHLAEARDADDPLSTATRLVEALSTTAAAHPHLVRLLLHESFTDSERLDDILRGLSPLADTVEALLPRLQAMGKLTRFTPRALLLHLLLTTSAPFALAGLSGRLLGGSVGTPKGARAQAERVVELLL
ncbi:transcriptional regulator, TetR family [Streptoalloteichus tenebrarius]|uniref:Transcriptional regulator, TetR family n=1 Tax=Streptoalloteichus tenebrarius (strain ATCC 17920 / DSM 40477 / JCM 4838 / CBS 697.72 / NBRC 16177 / NCIMB 11028 / NRRL B-12390 / A12253. 1 / ISP 5477) TaxID=1933 RepID=A0ABT1HLZ0_STRSD|nr:TetR/AcrR family transcriptional regulator [Streptoalloteichus tenebrarius]MCP2256509.1 transcriptional regulator, TetR family [Streptoalloteichus tenebrarius]BFF04860.1 hypothetical protein GCM10020241_65350 [Streptoalloteichus tenebrarius]